MPQQSSQRLFARMLLLVFALLAATPHARAASWNDGFKHVGSLSNLPGYARDVKLDGERAYLQLSDINPGRSWYQYISVIDVKNPKRPRLLATLDTTDTLKGFDVAGGKLYTAETRYVVETIYNQPQARPASSRVIVQDLKNPDHPKALGAFKIDGGVQALKVDGSRAYLVKDGGAFLSLDISNPKQPRELGSVQLPDPVVASLVISRGRAFMVGTGKVLIVNVADPRRLTLEPPLTPTGFVYGFSGLAILPQAEKLFISTAWDLTVCNWKLPPDQAELTRYKMYSYNDWIMGSCAMALSHNRLFIPLGANGVRAIDVSDIYSNDFMRGNYQTPGDACAVAAREHLLYVATGQRGLTILKFEDED